VERLRARFGSAIVTTLVPGERGVFDVDVAGKRLFSKHAEQRFPDPGEIEDVLAPLVGT
jgi:hypothetical protein